MRKHILVVITAILVLALAAVAMAADPIIGTWKLNVAKSKYPPSQTAPKEGMDVYREVGGGQIELTNTRTSADGSSDVEIITWPAQGGTVTILKGEAGISYVETMIEPGNWYATCLQNGEQRWVMHKTFSTDGKTMTLRRMGKDAEGRPYEILEVLDKQ